MNGATVLTRFTGDTKDLDNKTKNAESKIAGLTSALVSSGLIVNGLSKSWGILRNFIGQSVDAFADVEQSLGGIETIYGDAGSSIEHLAEMFNMTTEEAKKYYDELDSTGANVTENAKRAFKTAGMSANQYMQTVTSFGASLMQALDGDTAEAARIADMAIIDMADNANKMGTSIESIQNAYQGFAKQNYTMLDNLKLGYGGTKTEMERLLADAEKFSGIKYDISNLADVYSAIHVIQDNLGIMGTTSQEASSTITGSINSAKSAFQNFIAGQGGIEEVVTTFVTAGQNISNVIIKMLPQIVQGLVGIVNGLMPLLPDIIKALLPVLIQGTVDLTIGIINMLPDLILMIAELLPSLMPMIVDAILSIIPAIYDNLPLFIEAGAKLLGGLIAGIVNSIPILLARLGEITVKMIKTFKEINLLDVGKNILKGLWNGISSMKDWVINKVKDIGKSILKGLKGILGIKSPSKEFALIGKFSVLGYTEALDDMQKDVQKQVGETFGISPQLANSSALNYTPNVQVVNNISMKQDPLGQMVNDIKTFSGGSKNDYNYGMGV